MPPGVMQVCAEPCVNGQIIEACSTVWWRQTLLAMQRVATSVHLQCCGWLPHLVLETAEVMRTVEADACVCVCACACLCVHSWNYYNISAQEMNGTLRQELISRAPPRQACISCQPSLPQKTPPRVLASFHVRRQWGKFLEVVFFPSYQLPLCSPAESAFVKLCNCRHWFLCMLNSFLEWSICTLLQFTAVKYSVSVEKHSIET